MRESARESAGERYRDIERKIYIDIDVFNR